MRALHPVCRHYAFLSKRVIHTSTTAPTKATMIDPIIPRRARFPACQRPDLRRCKSPRWPETRLWEAKYEALGVLSATLTLGLLQACPSLDHNPQRRRKSAAK